MAVTGRPADRAGYHLVGATRSGLCAKGARPARAFRARPGTTRQDLAPVRKTEDKQDETERDQTAAWPPCGYRSSGSRRSIPAMAERWRVAIVLGGAAGGVLWGCKRDIAREIQDRAGAVVAGVPRSAWQDSGESPFSAYTGSRATAEAAAQVAQEVASRQGLAARVTVECWRQAKAAWEDASAVSESDLAEERDNQEREDRRLSAETGVAQWQVRAHLRTHRDTVALAHRLSGDGHQIHQRWKSVVASADTEDDANRLVEKIRQYAASNVEVRAERADTPDWADQPSYGPDFPLSW